MENTKRFKEFVDYAHKAKQKSGMMINRLIEHAVKTGDKKAVSILQAKSRMTQLMWKDP